MPYEEHLGRRLGAYALQRGTDALGLAGPSFRLRRDGYLTRAVGVRFLGQVRSSESAVRGRPGGPWASPNRRANWRSP
jgi:hypothetical protein